MVATETLGQAIRRTRMSKGLSLRDLAYLVGVSPPFLSDLEHDRRSTRRLREIAAALGTTEEHLTARDPHRCPECGQLMPEKR